MKITVQKITTIADAHAAISSTKIGPTIPKATLRHIYGWEHSPSRTQLFWVIMEGIPSFVSVHFVRHAAVGQQHYVMSNRVDRGGDGNDTVTRNYPVNHRMLLNAQHLIDMSRRRLCYQASTETMLVMQRIKSEVAHVDMDLSRYMVPNCVYRNGICSEPKPCGNFKIKKYDPEKIRGEMPGVPLDPVEPFVIC